MNAWIRGGATLALVAFAGCAYYNAMWSAERFARQARQAEAKGRDAEARGLWGRAAVKAESVVVRHPQSRWTDDAMVLRAEALVRAGACSQAATALGRAAALSLDPALRERTDLAAAECALVGGRWSRAKELLVPILESENDDRRARAAYLAGRVEWEQGNGVAAAWLLARSSHPAAVLERARVLLASGQSEPALALLDSLVSRRFDEAEWTWLLDSTAGRAGPPAASAVLDRLLARGRVPPDAAARLLTADGDRRAAAFEGVPAAERYAAAAAIAPDAGGADLARVRRLQAVAMQATSMDDLAPLAEALTRARNGPGDYRALAATLERMRQRANDVAAFRAAELARDSLHAPALAGALFLEVAARWPASVFAPKAIVAAMALLPDRRDSLRAKLDAAYASSPYTLALRGEATPGFLAAEDSLARALGLDLAVEVRPVIARVAPPVAGPRSVSLEPPASATAAVRPARRPGPPARVPVRAGERPDERP